MRGKQPVLRLREMSDGPCGQVASPAGPRRALLGLGLCLVTTFALGSCTPYERQSGEYLAGSVDPIKFPAAYLGQDGDAKKPGAGTFRYQTAMVRGTKVAYYPLPMTGAQASAPDPLDVNRLRLPLAYIFDPQAGPSPRDSQNCIRPEDYKFDRYRDAVRMDRQGNVFTQLPAESDPAGDSRYVPIVREVVVTSKQNPCQDVKSEESLVTRTDLQVSLAPPMAGALDSRPIGRPSSRLLAFAIIDPAADVQLPDGKLDEVTGLGPQRWGFLNRYLLAYLDGGYIPLSVLNPAGKLRMVTQDLYYPSTVFDAATQMEVDGSEGTGYDVMQFKRSEDGYSPVCRVLSFDPVDPKAPETSVSEILALTTVHVTGRYIYCLQAP
jgi:hypothetical protein